MTGSRRNETVGALGLLCGLLGGVMTLFGRPNGPRLFVGLCGLLAVGFGALLFAIKSWSLARSDGVSFHRALWLCIRRFFRFLLWFV
jgi:hypothetical protein